MDSGVQDSGAPLYNTAAVVQRTGVPATTFRAWERRYGAPKPRRDARDQRLYSERDIQTIRWFSEQTSHGVAISRAVAMLRGGYAAFGNCSAPAVPSAARSFAALRTELLDALLAFDLSRADRLRAEAFALFSIEDVCLHIIEPLLVEVGHRWHAGELSVADEHHISSFIRARLFSLLTAYQSHTEERPAAPSTPGLRRSGLRRGPGPSGSNRGNLRRADRHRGQQFHRAHGGGSPEWTARSTR